MKQTILSQIQSELLEKLIVKYGQIVTSEQVYKEVGGVNDKQQAKKIVTKLVSNGWLIRIKRGLYAISDFSTRGFLSLSPYVVANLLVRDSYVSFESALSHYGMFDQLTSRIISISSKSYKKVQIGNVEYSYVNVKDQYIFGWQVVNVDGKSVRIATAEKALIDIVHFHKSKYAIDLVIEKIITHKESIDIQQLSGYASKMSPTTIKIFGFIFDLLHIDSSSLYSAINSKRSTHWMLTDDKKFNAKWRLYYDEYFDKYELIK